MATILEQDSDHIVLTEIISFADVVRSVADWFRKLPQVSDGTTWSSLNFYIRDRVLIDLSDDSIEVIDMPIVKIRNPFDDWDTKTLIVPVANTDPDGYQYELLVLPLRHTIVEASFGASSFGKAQELFVVPTELHNKIFGLDTNNNK